MTSSPSRRTRWIPSFSESCIANAKSDRLIDRQTVGHQKRGVCRIVSAYYRTLLYVCCVGLRSLYKIKSIEPVYYIHYTAPHYRYKDIHPLTTTAYWVDAVFGTKRLSGRLKAAILFPSPSFFLFETSSFAPPSSASLFLFSILSSPLSLHLTLFTLNRIHCNHEASHFQ